MKTELEKQHADMVSSLVKKGERLKEEIGAFQLDIWHAATGIATEAGELMERTLNIKPTLTKEDRENYIEELGDLEFYIEQLRRALSIERRHIHIKMEASFHNIVVLKVLNSVCRLCIDAGNILDLSKKVAIYNKPPDFKKYEKAIDVLELNMERLRSLLNINRDETLCANLNKLAVRYPNYKYSDTLAHERLDKK